MSDISVIYHAENEPMAHALANLLQSEGIDAVVQGHSVQLAWGTTHWASSRVVVPTEQESKARIVVEKFEAQLREQRRNPRNDDDEDEPMADEADDRIIDAHIWPKCPQCNEPRPGQCPFCKHSGHDFQPAYGTMGGEERMVVCPQCDEAFHPIFFRLCHNCGHDYGDGKEIAQRRKGGEGADVDSNWRVYIVLAVVVLAIVAIFAYFQAATAPFVQPSP